MYPIFCREGEGEGEEDGCDRLSAVVEVGVVVVVVDMPG